MAFINPDDISIKFLHKLHRRFYNTQIDANKVQKCLTLLLKYSLISSSYGLNIHRLVQLALRDRMSSKKVEMLKNFWASFDPEEWNQIEMGNILTIWNHTSTSKMDKHRASKIFSVYSQLIHFGMVNESYNFAIESCKFLLDLFGPEHEEYLKMEFYLASALREKGRYESALVKATNIHQKFKELRGDEALWGLTSGHLVARILFDLGRFQDSLKWGREVLQSRIRIYGGRSENVMRTRNIVASTLQEIGEKKEALEIYFGILEWRESNLGAEHPSTLDTRHNIATCFYDMGMFKEAMGIFKEILALRDIHLAYHPITLNTKGWLADTLDKMGETQGALKIHEEVEVAREKVLGAEHPHTLKARGRVASLKNKRTEEEPQNI